MLDLPQEILYHLFKFLENEDLAVCSKVCRRWQIANVILYRSVDLYRPSQTERFLRCIANNQLGKRVTRLGLLWHGDQEKILQELISACPNVEVFESPMPVWNTLTKSCWQLKKLPEPKKEDSAYSRCIDHFRHSLIHFQYTIVDAWAFDTQLKRFPHLNSLRLISHAKFRYSRNERPLLTLTHLEVSLDTGTLNYIAHKFPSLQSLVIQQPLVQGLESHFQQEGDRWVKYLENKHFRIVLPFSPALFAAYAPFVHHLVIYQHIEAILEISPHRAFIGIKDSRWDPAWGAIDPMVYVCQCSNLISLKYL
ncbi:hypothetical protein BY458DRAFT_514938 [Sporodiniella umbellata]|nr:hypothetical protein BY458DRAFT_514938 [Sporodiniella umbellata]